MRLKTQLTQLFTQFLVEQKRGVNPAISVAYQLTYLIFPELKHLSKLGWWLHRQWIPFVGLATKKSRFDVKGA